jgi:hypothetical protein
MFSKEDSLVNLAVFFLVILSIFFSEMVLADEAVAGSKELRIAIFDFKNLTSQGGLGNEVAEEVRSRLMDLRSQGIVVVEREDLYELIGKEEERKQEGLMEERYQDEEVAVKGIDVQVNGKVLSLNLETFKEVQPMSTRYKAGTRRVPNPAYQQMQQQQQQMQTQYSGDPKLQSFANLTGQFASMAVPQYLSEDVYATYNYNRYTYTKAASFKMSCKIINNRDGEVLFNRTLRKKHQARDTLVEGDSTKGVRQDPLDLISDFEIKEKVKTDAIDEIVGHVKQVLSRLTGKDFAGGIERESGRPEAVTSGGKGNVIRRFKALKDLYESGIITREEYEAKRKQLLNASF